MRLRWEDEARIKSLEAQNADMLAMLEGLEWINEVVEEGVTLCLCPECDTGNVHMPDCKLGNLLKQIKGETSC
jgi:hypothetical protein